MSYDFAAVASSELAPLRKEQAALLDDLNDRITSADLDARATIEAEMLWGFELLAAIDAEISRRDG